MARVTINDVTYGQEFDPTVDGAACAVKLTPNIIWHTDEVKDWCDEVLSGEWIIMNHVWDQYSIQFEINDDMAKFRLAWGQL